MAECAVNEFIIVVAIVISGIEAKDKWVKRKHKIIFPVQCKLAYGLE